MRHRRPLLAAAVFAFSLLLWAGVRQGPWRGDDFLVPLGDTASASLPGLAAHAHETLRPATKLTYAVEGSLGVDAAPARRVVSAVFFSAGAAAFALLLMALCGRPGARVAADVGCALVAAAWAAHPVHAESILAVAGRSAALSGALLLAALAAAAGGGRRVAAVAFVLAVLARETALAGLFPLVLMCASRGTGRPGAGPRRTRRVLGAAVIVVVLAGAWLASVPRYRHLAEFSFGREPWARPVARQLAAIPAGLALYVQPASLSADHGRALPESPLHPRALLGAALVLSAALAALVAARRAPAVATGLALWVAAIAPTQTLVPKLDPLTERPLSLALAGLLMAIAGAGALVLRAPVPRRVLVPASAGALALVLVLAAETRARGRLYADDVALWGDAAAKSAVNPRPHINFAVALNAAGRYAESAAAFRAALAIDPLNLQAERGAAAMAARAKETEWQHGS